MVPSAARAFRKGVWSLPTLACSPLHPGKAEHDWARKWGAGVGRGPGDLACVFLRGEPALTEGHQPLETEAVCRGSFLLKSISALGVMVTSCICCLCIFHPPIPLAANLQCTLILPIRVKVLPSVNPSLTLLSQTCSLQFYAASLNTDSFNSTYP